MLLCACVMDSECCWGLFLIFKPPPAFLHQQGVMEEHFYLEETDKCISCLCVQGGRGQWRKDTCLLPAHTFPSLPNVWKRPFHTPRTLSYQRWGHGGLTGELCEPASKVTKKEWNLSKKTGLFGHTWAVQMKEQFSSRGQSLEFGLKSNPVHLWVNMCADPQSQNASRFHCEILIKNK